MQIIVSLDGTITVSKKRERENKGSSRVEVLSDYTVLDIETTGLDPSFDAILRYLQVESGKIRLKTPLRLSSNPTTQSTSLLVSSPV